MNDIIDFFSLRSPYLIESLVRRKLKLKYRRSSLGFMWSLFVPLLMALTYLLLFKFIMKFDVPYYAFILSLGTITWSFYTVACYDGVLSILGNYGLASKVPISFNTFALSSTITAFINYLLAFPVIIGLALYSGLSISISYLALPFVFMMLFFFTYFFAIILAILNVYFRDLEQFIGVSLQLWMYATPILYPASMVPSKYAWLLYLNPIAPLFISLHNIFIEGTWPNWTMLSVGLLWVGIAFSISFYLFKRVRYTVLENV